VAEREFTCFVVPDLILPGGEVIRGEMTPYVRLLAARQETWQAAHDLLDGMATGFSPDQQAEWDRLHAKLDEIDWRLSRLRGLL